VKAPTASQPIRVTTRNAAFQQWRSLLTNRTKRGRAGEFVVQGVRPISAAVEQGWTIRVLLHDGRPVPSSWASQLWSSVAARRVVMAPELMAELGERTEGVPELVAVVEMPPDDLDRIPLNAVPLIAAFDRPASPGNIGTLLRSLDAFGGSALVTTGHAADPYDPKCIRASTGSIFSVPVVRAPSHREVFDWIDTTRSGGTDLIVVGTDEAGEADVADTDLRRASLVVVGNETAGMTEAWRDRCDVLIRIPMGGTASSLNAATAGSIVLYEAMRQRSGTARKSRSD
jgi:TrmH family RNA methyltransferase